MRNISEIKDCYGCGVCATVCGQKIIEMVLNDEGFYEPRITDTGRCTDCGLCTTVCSFCHDGRSVELPPMGSYAAWSKNSAIRRSSTSGGVSHELGLHLLKHGGKVCGVRYNTKTNRAEHYIASTPNEWEASVGSKYIQSYTLDAFRAINSGEKHLIIGSPCQIDSLRRYLRLFKKEDNFTLIDFFCHGVPSMHLWHKYIQWVNLQIGEGEYSHVSWRNKATGWHHSYVISIRNSRGGEISSAATNGDLFYKLFFSDTCLGKQCYRQCKFRYASSAADIRIGDMWGDKYANDENGVNAVITFTPKGEALLRAAKTLHIEPLPLSTVAAGQIKSSMAMPSSRQQVIDLLKAENATLRDAHTAALPHIRRQKLTRLLRNPLGTIKKFIGKVYKT